MRKSQVTTRNKKARLTRIKRNSPKKAKPLTIRERLTKLESEVSRLVVQNYNVVDEQVADVQYEKPVVVIRPWKVAHVQFRDGGKLYPYKVLRTADLSIGEVVATPTGNGTVADITENQGRFAPRNWVREKVVETEIEL